MRRGRPVPPIVLNEREQQTLEQWSRRPTTAQALAVRARLVLRCARGETATAIARELRVTKQTVGKWRTRFLVDALTGVHGFTCTSRPRARRGSISSSVGLPR